MRSDTALRVAGSNRLRGFAGTAGFGGAGALFLDAAGAVRFAGFFPIRDRVSLSAVRPEPVAPRRCSGQP